MWAPRARPFVRLCTLGALAAMFGVAGALAAVSGPRSYDDPVGETDGPDVSDANLVANDNRSITFVIHVPNRLRFLEGETYSAYLDTDRDPATGSAGAEYVISASRMGGSIHRFDGERFVPVAARVAAGWVSGTGPVMELPRGAVPARRFDFFLEARGAEADRAPNDGVWSYAVRPLRLRARGLVVTPAVAGRQLTASARVIASDWNTELDVGRILCAARVGRRRIRGTGSFRGGRASCSWQLPRNAAGRLFAAGVGVSYQGASGTAAFRRRVRP